MRDIRIAAAGMLALLLLSGCAVAKLGGRGPVPLLLNNPPVDTELVAHFSKKKLLMFDYTSSFDVSEMLGEQIQSSGADAVINLSVIVKVTPLAYLLNAFTGGLAGAKTFYVSGDLVRFPHGSAGLLPVPGADGALATGPGLERLPAN
ncbi:MAG: hypothetical protein OEY97_04700 [Nitrospirota bacterium]|nr:hypothetical protein [Nitrospirota bacterium]